MYVHGVHERAQWTPRVEKQMFLLDFINIYVHTFNKPFDFIVILSF